MPRDHGTWLDQNEGVGPVLPYPPKYDPEQAIESIQHGTGLLALVNSKLLSKSDGLRGQSGAGDHKRPPVGQHRRQERNHQSDATQPLPNLLISLNKGIG
jgi:hypothetical protein